MDEHETKSAEQMHRLSTHLMMKAGCCLEAEIDCLTRFLVELDFFQAEVDLDHVEVDLDQVGVDLDHVEVDLDQVGVDLDHVEVDLDQVDVDLENLAGIGLAATQVGRSGFVDP